MLSSAPKSVPTREQFAQPYFIEIALDGAIKASCARFANLLKQKNIPSFLGKNALEILHLLGTLPPDLSHQFPQDAIPEVMDLSITGPGLKSYLIRWVPAPVYDLQGETVGWQLSGIKIDLPGPGKRSGRGEEDCTRVREEYTGAVEDYNRVTEKYTRDPKDDPQYQDSLVRYVYDIIITTDLQDQVVYWNKAAEQFYGIPSRQAIGRRFRDLVRQEYGATTAEDVKKAFHDKGFWDGEAIYVSKDGKKSYLISSIRYIRDSEGRITGIVAINKDVTENKLAQQEKEKAEAQLHQYSEQMINILESITDGFFALDKDFKVTLWNQEAERITHLSSGEMVGQPIWEKLPELVDPDTYLSFQKAFSKKMTVTLERYNERFDRWLEMSVYPSAQGLFAYFKDVTTRKKQEALLALEKKVLEMNSSKKTSLRSTLNYFLKSLQKTFPGMYCCVMTLDQQNRTVQILSAPGLPAAYAHAIDGLPIGPGAGSAGTAIYRKEKVIVSDIESDPLWKHHKDMALKFGLRACWSFPMLNAKKEGLAAFAVYHTSPKSPSRVELDIIERAANLITIVIESKRAEEQLNISNERYTLATKATNDAIWDLDFHTGLYFWGEGYYNQFGHQPGPKVLTRQFWELHIHPEDRAQVLQEMEKFIGHRNKGLWQKEYRFKRSDGKYALVSDRAYLIFGKDGKLARMVGSMQDITGKREMEKKLLNQELTKQKIVAQAMVDAQEKERAEIGKELHDNINQILSTTKLYLELAKNDDKERVNLITRSAGNIHDAIHEIRNISRSLVPASISDLGLHDSIVDLVESIRTTRAIHVEFHPVGQFDERISDKEKLMLFRIIQEQINNVLKHSGARNLIIELILAKIENKIELNIIDDGKGFNPGEVKDKKGLGLSNIMSRADLFGGKVTIVSSPGRGCQLRVEVPVQNDTLKVLI